MDNKVYCYSEDVVIDSIQFRAKVDEVVWLMTHGSQVVPIKQNSLLYLYKETTIIKSSYCSSIDDENRMNSIVDEIKALETASLSSFKHALFLIQTSKDQPLTMTELNKLQDITILLPASIEIIWGLGVDDTLDDRIFFTLVCSK